MSIKRYVDGKWVEVAGSSSMSTGQAINVSIIDNDDLFESSNVEGALNELAYELQNISNDFTNHKNNSSIHGGGGGGGSMPTITSDFEINKSDGISYIDIPIYYTSPNLGEGIAYILINNVEVGTQTVQQGNNTIIVPPLGAGRNIIVSIYVKDRAGLLSNQLNWTVTSGGISLTMLTDTSADYNESSRVVLRYSITCMTGEAIQVYFTIDGEEFIAEAINGYNTYEITGLKVGVHKIEYYAISGEYSTNKEIFTLIIVNSNELIIHTDFDAEKEYESGIPISIPYKISIDKDEDFVVKLYINGTLIKQITTRPTSLYWTISSLNVGTHILRIQASNDTLGISNYIEFQCRVIQGEYSRILPVQDASLLAWFDATERTNNDSDRDIWTDKICGNIGKLYNFNYGSNGWLKQEGKEISELVMDGTCYVEIDMTPFKDNFKNGGVIELVFKTRDVGNSNARVLDITDVLSPYKGVYIDTKEAYISSSAQKINAAIGEDEYIHILYDIDRINKYIHVVVNGVITKSCKLSDSGSGTSAILESIAHSQKIYLNCQKGADNFGSCEITHLRIYDRNLTFDEILQNYLSTFDDITIQKAKADFNDPIKNIMPVMNITCDADRFETMTDTNKIEVSMTYTSPNAELYGTTLTTATNCLMYWQGTSSVGYNVHNYNILLRDNNREEIMYSPFQDCIPQSLFCLKANLMESTNAHNVGLADYVRRYLYTTQTPAQKIDSKASRTIQGFPILLYINGEAMGVYDFNLDRYSTKAFGYELEQHKNTCRVYEISANTNTTAGAFVPWDTTKNVDEWTWYKNDFTGIYPTSIQNSINDDFKELKTLISFVYNSTDEEFTTNFATYFDKESVIRYYIIVMCLGLVDSLGKNAKLVTYDGIKWYFDFYDMDTAIGLDNTGALKYDVDIEVNPDQFNTADSVLWSRIRDLFSADITAEYLLMRNNNLTLDKIYECLFTNQIEKISESQYNFTTQKRYLDTGEYIMMSNGNRYYGIKRWLKERLIYCDTLFGYSATTSKYITLRSGIEGSVYLDIQTYYPMYITVEWRNQADGSGRQTLKVGRDKVVRFNGVVQAKDQEVLVYGAEHLKDIGKMNGMRPRHLLLNNAYRLTSVECPGNTELLSVQMEQCSYLQRIDLSGCTSLGTLNTSQVLDVSGCNNLRYLNAFNTVITSISTNQSGGNLVEIYVPKTLQSLSLRNQYSLRTVGIPNHYHLWGSVNDMQNNGSSLSTFSLINCPLVDKLTYYDINANTNFYDGYMNLRNSNEFATLKDYDKWKNLVLWGNGLANATEIYIENSCHNIEHMSFRGMENIINITLRNLPNLKTLLLGSNCSGCRWNNAPNYDSDKYDLTGELDWENGLIIRDCPNIEEFRIHEFYNNQNQTWFNFKEGTNSINLAEKFPNLKLFECNMAIQNIHQIILPQSLTTFMNTTWSGYNTTDYPHKWIYEKFNIDSIYFEGEHNTDYIGVDLGNHEMTDTCVTAPYTPEIKGINIKNYYVNPCFNIHKEDNHETRPSVVPQGRINISEFKWRTISDWFAYVDFTQGICEIVEPDDYDEFLKGVTQADRIFYHCTNPDFTWEFAMKFFPKITSSHNNNNGLNGGLATMYQHAKLKEQIDYETDGVDMYCENNIGGYNYQARPFTDTNLKYIKSFILTNNSGAYGTFYDCTSLIKVGECKFTGTNSWYGINDLFRGCTNLEEVGSIYSSCNKENNTTIESSAVFLGCIKLKKVRELNFASNNMDSFYNNCPSLTDEGLSLPNIEQVTRLSNTFRQCSNLTNIHLEGIGRDTPLGYMGYCFYQCTSLKTVSISGDTLPIALREMHYMYDTCSVLTNLLPIPQDFTYDVAMQYCCYNCKALTDSAIYSEIPYRVTNIQYMYGRCDSLIEPVVNVASDNVYARNMFEYCNGLLSLTVNFTGRLLRNAQFFAQHCDYLETINFTFPESLVMHTDYYQTGIEYYNMFQYCQNLTNVNLNMSRLANTNTKADFGGMFYQNKYIKVITGLDFTYLKKPAYTMGNSGYGAYDWHNDSITYGGSYDELEILGITGMLQGSYNFRNITTLRHTKEILKHLDTVTSETIGLTYNVMDAINDELNEYVDEELRTLALAAIDKGWTFAVV